MTDRDVFLSYRLRVIRFGLVVGWTAFGATILLASQSGRLAEEGVGIRAVLAALVLFGASVVPWQTLLKGPTGDLLIVAWATLAIAGLVAVGDLRDGEPLVAAYLGVIVFAGATLMGPVLLSGVALISSAGYTIALSQYGVTMGAGEFLLRVGAFAAATIFSLLTAAGVSRELHVASLRLNRLDKDGKVLARRQQELDQLYAVSRTIGVDSKLSEVIPELVHLIVGSVGARIGLAFMYRADTEALELMSPMWVAGQPVEAHGHVLPLTDPGMVQRVFTSGEAMVRADPASHGASNELFVELNTSEVAAVPLRVGARTIGVLMVADKLEGTFTPADADRLETLAGPAALVLNQLVRYEEARETSEKMAELAQLKTDFVSVVSHELRTPLTSIIGSLKTLQRPELAPESPNARDLIETAERQANRLRALIEDLLVVSRLDNQALPVRPIATDLRELIGDVLRYVPRADTLVTADISAELPVVHVDQEHLHRILRNLIENALKYAPSSAVEVTARPTADEVWISIVDHGAGIPYELHDHIFQRFTQVERHETRGVGGTGLGLSIVRGLSEAMGGRVWFEPTVGGGATFTVSLPRRIGVRPLH